MKRLSSRLTILMRFIAPSFMTLLALSFLVSSLKSGTWDSWFDILIPFVLTVAFWWYCWPLKRVDYDGQELVISDYFREIRVPVSQVSGVHQSLFESNRTVTLTFDPTTEFGRTIRFIPRELPDSLLKEDVWVKELRETAAAARTHSG